ncbi:MAG: DUF5684 domain-containing protein, partial [Clostridia bacterium]|nr:DUF5684 domain-containing protein [Clostridia bacterium]
MYQSTFAAASIVTVLLVLTVIGLSLLVLIAQWVALSKSGDGGWKVLIPIYGPISVARMGGGGAIACCIINMVGASIIGVIGNQLQNALFYYMRESEIITYLVLVILLAIACIVCTIIENVKIAHAFGRTGGFGFMMCLLPIVFWPILGFGANIYVGNGNNAPVSYTNTSFAVSNEIDPVVDFNSVNTATAAPVKVPTVKH